MQENQMRLEQKQRDLRAIYKEHFEDTSVNFDEDDENNMSSNNNVNANVNANINNQNRLGVHEEAEIDDDDDDDDINNASNIQSGIDALTNNI